MRYFNPREIKEKKEEIKGQLVNYCSKIIKIGKAERLVDKYVSEKNSKILDIGCASGFFLQSLFEKRYKNLYGLDIDDYLNKNTDKSIKNNFKTADVSIEPLPWETYFFDAITLWGTIEHIENPYFLAREINRVLKPKGIFIFSLPNVSCLKSRLIFLKHGDFPRWSETSNHISILTKNLVKKGILKYFDLLEVGYANPSFDYKFFQKFKWPENKWFGNIVYYVLKKK